MMQDKITTKCLVCKKGEIEKDNFNSNWYRCNSCGADSDKLVDGFLYPLERRGTLCELYTPVNNLDVSFFKVGEEVKFYTSRKSIKIAKVIHIDLKGKKMIIEELSTKRIRFVIDNEEIANAYDALFPINKVAYAGWWNRRIEFIS